MQIDINRLLIFVLLLLALWLTLFKECISVIKSTRPFKPRGFLEALVTSVSVVTCVLRELG